MSETKPKFVRSLVRRPLLAAVLAASSVAPAAPAIAAFDIFLKIDGIEGESTAPGHEGSIELSSFDLGINNRTCLRATEKAARVSVSGFVITKLIDKSSPTLFASTTSGQTYPSGELDVVNMSSPNSPGGGQHLKFELKDLLISSVDYSAASSDPKPTETLSLSFAQVQWSYSIQNSDGTATPVTGSFNCGNRSPEGN